MVAALPLAWGPTVAVAAVADHAHGLQGHQAHIIGDLQGVMKGFECGPGVDDLDNHMPPGREVNALPRCTMAARPYPSRI